MPKRQRYTGVIARLTRHRASRRAAANPFRQLAAFLTSPRLPVWASAASVVAHLAGCGRLARRLDAVAILATAAHQLTPTPRRAPPADLDLAIGGTVPALCLALDILYRRRARGPAVLGSLAVLAGMYLCREKLLGMPGAAPPRRRVLGLLPRPKELRRTRRTNGLHIAR